MDLQYEERAEVLRYERYNSEAFRELQNLKDIIRTILAPYRRERSFQQARSRASAVDSDNVLLEPLLPATAMIVGFVLDILRSDEFLTLLKRGQ